VILAIIVAAPLLSHASAGRVALAQEASAGHVETIPLDGELTSWGRLGGVSVDALGFVYSSAFGEEVWKIAPDGTVSLLADGFYGASGNAIDLNGDLLQAGFFSNSIHRISRTGEVSLVTNEGLAGPVAIAVGKDGVLYVCSCNNNSVTRVARDGTASVFARSDLFACPNGITFDDQGDLYVVSFSNDHLVRVNAEGSAELFTTVEPEGGYSEQAIAAGVEGNAHVVFTAGAFFVTKIKTNSLWRVASDGTATHFAGTFAYGQGDGPLMEASFAAPNGIAARRGVLYLNDMTGTWRQTARAALAIRKVILPR